MATYLLTWNAEKWEWTDLAEEAETCAEQGFLPGDWSCGNTKKIKSGDRFFLLKQGKAPRGIMASGTIISSPYPERHWDKSGRPALYVDIEFDTLLNPENELILDRGKLDKPPFSDMYWNTQASGTTIPYHVAIALEKVWAKLVKKKTAKEKVGKLEEISSETLEIEREISTGAGFGNPETNKKVEKAAVEFVTKQYKKDGWVVASVELAKCGYDLKCSKLGLEEHVEVKGVSGIETAFIITANEVREAKNNPRFVICVVTSAVSASPKMNKFTGAEFVKKFNLNEIAYRAVLKNKA